MWQKTTITGDIVPIKKSTNNDTVKQMAALNKLRRKNKSQNTSTFVHFDKPTTTLTATICRLDKLNDLQISTSSQTKSVDNNILEDFIIEKPLFFWDDYHNRLCKNIDDKVIDVANFECVIISEVTEVTKDSTIIYIEVAVIFKSKRLIVKIEKSLLQNLKKKIIQEFPQCYIYNDNSFQEYISNLYGNSSDKNLKTFYRFSGWYQLSNKFVFFNNSMQNVSSKVTLSGTANEAREFFYLFMKISIEPKKMLLVLLYSLSAYTAYFYEKCKIDGLRSVLYLSAPTGTGKTSVAKILASAILNDGEKAILRFDDTIASLEESLFDSKDLLILVDDFYAKGSKFDDQAFKAKASAITRIVGDGMIKGKMGANRKPLPDRKYRGGVIATGEYIDLNTHSSYLRCWCINLKANSVIFDDSLSTLQKNPNLPRAFFSLWIWWLQEKQDFILENLKNEHNKFLKLCAENFNEPYPRFASNIATFLTINYFFYYFCQDCDITYNIQRTQEIILSEATEQLDMLKQYSPSKIVIEALRDAIENAYLNIADTEDDFRSHNFDGFFTSTQIIIITAKMETAIEKYTIKKNYGLKFNTALKDELVQKNILKISNGEINCKYTKARLISPKRPRVYTINKGAIFHE